MTSTSTPAPATPLAPPALLPSTRRPARAPLGSTPVVVGTVALAALGAFESLAVSTAMPVIAAALDGLALFATAFAITNATSVIGMVIARPIGRAHL